MVEDVPDMGDSWLTSAQDWRNREANVPQLSDDMRAAISGEVVFTAGNDVHDPLADSLQEALAGVPLFDAAAGLWQGDDEAPLPDVILPEDDDVVTHEGDSPIDALTPQDIADLYFGAAESSPDLFPYPNKAMLKTDILFSSPRLRFSRSQQQAVLAWGRELGAKNVPTLHALHRFQSEALDAVGNPTVKVTAASGNVFYMNEVTKAIAKDYTHPATRSLIHAYPEYTPNAVSEVWQAEKWLVEAPDHLLTPMIRQDNQDYYTNELAHCSDDSWFIPTRFFEHAGQMMAVGHDAIPSSVRYSFVSRYDCSNDVRCVHLRY
ncbi:hypothetical protein GLOTRDRAFT_134493 [Gloeophyllum trabeum ATCC 11539]|uniref:Uncharacterized protein n=1 Tax=Gloeophyllum trabeum (strain ATCC 11539 / FP-39264 / Madison 617) TaxID=670483 RepID=S7R678_GLOTA|nr:uncharacterized protein GLOTRDRAFT_134493 [Gloeophyllum trabeum ATCC 11539]EPQ49890.1 hypothetical protein GLOTRDRAFT_134493 [Gloeophyllum trabeum ATCC 11539]